MWLEITILLILLLIATWWHAVTVTRAISDAQKLQGRVQLAQGKMLTRIFRAIRSQDENATRTLQK